MWLNEAVTVHIEKEHHEFLFGKNYSRLQEVLSLLSPDHGVFSQDEGTLILPIIPEGFNNPDELITSVTYVKSPEFIKMFVQDRRRQSVQILRRSHSEYIAAMRV